MYLCLKKTQNAPRPSEYPPVRGVFVRYLCMAINDIVQYTSGFLPYILLFTQDPILVWLDGTMIDISTILVTMYYRGYVGL